MLQTLLSNIGHNLFKPLLLFFYAGFLIPILGVSFEFPQVIYQGLVIYLLLSIGWRGGEELAELSPDQLGTAFGFMLLGFVVNLIIGIIAYYLLRKTTKLRNIDAATVAGYYGSDSAGTFVTCLGVLTAAQIAFAPFMPVMLAVMEIPGCLFALVVIAKLRRRGMDKLGNMPGEPGFTRSEVSVSEDEGEGDYDDGVYSEDDGGELVAVGSNGEAMDDSHDGPGHLAASGNYDHVRRNGSPRPSIRPVRGGVSTATAKALEEEEKLAIITVEKDAEPIVAKKTYPKHAPLLSAKLMHEVFLNPGIFLLFAGITIGFISRLQGEAVTKKNDTLFVDLFQGVLCLFLLEMGMTASKKLKDLKTAGWGFVAFGLIAPNLFATFGMLMAHGYSMMIGHPFDVGTYVLFAVLCGAASYIAVPAVQRLAIPEASPTLPLAASLGLTFSYNVTIGIPIYIMIATEIVKRFPVGG